MTHSIVFDLDGTVLDVFNRHYLTYTEAISACEFRPVGFGVYRRLKRAGTPMKELFLCTGRPHAYPAFLKVFIRLIEKREYLMLDRPAEGMTELIQEVEPLAQVCLVTLRRRPANLRWQLKRLGMASQLDRVIAGSSQTDPPWEVKSSLVAGLGLDLTRAVLVGDSEADVLAGRLLGIPTCAVAFGLRTEAFLRALRPNYLVRNARQLMQTLEPFLGDS